MKTLEQERRALEQANDPAKTLEEMRRVLRGGRSKMLPVTPAEAYAQADRSLRGMVVEPVTPI